MPYLIAAALVLLLGIVTVAAVYRADTQVRSDRDHDRSHAGTASRP